MKEVDLYEPVKRWLEGQTLRVYPEVSVHYSPIDVVGIGESLIVGVELKLSCTTKLLRQASVDQLVCDRVYIAVATRPRSLERATQIGLGVLRVAGGVVTVLAEAVQQRIGEHSRKRIRETCTRLTGEGVGGVPCLDGVGPAQDCKRRVEEYKKAHLKATWAEVYEAVPNHYASAKSMAGALTTGLALRAHWKKLRRELKAQGQ